VVTTGVVLNERYRLDEAVAAGGMGQVWRATDVVLCRTVAVKTLLPAIGEDPDFGRRFQSEALIMASLHHPGLVEVYDYGQCSDEDVVYLVMQYVDGEPLSKRLAAGGLGVDATLSIMSQAARALHVAHRHGIVHRDVKPGNLLIESDGTVRLVDFGIARAMAATATTAHRVVGTALYIAPEQALGRTVTPATDVYGLGAVGYHCLTGDPPFPGDNPVQVALRHVDDEIEPLPEDIPEPVRTLIGTALAKDPAHRYATAAELADTVDAVRSPTSRSTAGRPQPVRPAPSAALPPTPVRTRAAAAPSTVDAAPADPVRSAWSRVSRRQVALAATVAAVLVGLAVWLGLLVGGPDSPGDRPAPVGPAPVTGSGTDGGTEGGRPTDSTTTRPTTTGQGGAGPTAGPTPTAEPEPTTDPPSTPDTTTDPVEPPPVTSAPAGSPQAQSSAAAGDGAQARHGPVGHRS
jgi:serine/threonine-protein kinase